MHTTVDQYIFLKNTVDRHKAAYFRSDAYTMLAQLRIILLKPERIKEK